MPGLAALIPGLPLAAYVESLIEGRAGVVFGNAASPLGQVLLERGARLVHVYDPDRVRVAEAVARNRSSNLIHAPLGEDGTMLREGAFDFAVVDNLAALVPASELLRRIKRALSRRGMALVASPNPDCQTRLVAEPTASHAPDYYSLFDQLAAEFAQVRMVGLVPFVGYLVAEFGSAAEAEPVFDTGYLDRGAEEPEWLLAVAGEQVPELEGLMVVELPAQSLIGIEQGGDLGQQLLQARQVEEDLRRRLAELEARLASQPTGSSLHQERVSTLEAELAKQERWIRLLEQRADTADARADVAEAELETVREQLEQAHQQLGALQRESTQLAEQGNRQREQLEQELRAAQAQVEQARCEQARLAEELLARDARISELEQQYRDEVARLEGQLRERSSEIERLEQELREAQRTGRELVEELRTAQAQGPALAALRSRVDALVALSAQQSAQLARAEWTIEVLRSELDARAAALQQAPPAEPLSAEGEPGAPADQAGAGKAPQVSRPPGDPGSSGGSDLVSRA